MTDLVVASATTPDGKQARVTVDVVGGTARSAALTVDAGIFGRLYAVAAISADVAHEWSTELDGTPLRIVRPIPTARRFAVDPWPEAVWVRLSVGTTEE